jgi:hypothetical protein
MAEKTFSMHMSQARGMRGGRREFRRYSKFLRERQEEIERCFFKGRKGFVGIKRRVGKVILY